MTTTIAPNDPRLSLRGVRRHGAGWRVEREVLGKPRRTPTLDIDTTAAQLVAAWEALAAGIATDVAGSLSEAVANYLKTVSAQPTAHQKAAHLELLMQFVGRDRKPSSVTPADIDRMIQHWHATPTIIAAGKRGRPAARLATDTIRKRLSNIQRFFAVMLPVGAVNPVAKCSQRPAPSKPEVRGVDVADIAAILDAMPDYRDTKNGAPLEYALAKIRAAVMAYTGLDPIQIQALKPTDMDLAAARPWLRSSRRKGSGGIRRFTLKLTDAGRDALVAFVNADAWGHYAVESVNRSIKRAAAKVGIEWGTFRAKDLRHSFGTEMYRKTRDQATVARFMCHAPGSKQTARYTAAANDEIDDAAAALFVAPKFKTPATPATGAKVVKMTPR